MVKPAEGIRLFSDSMNSRIDLKPAMTIPTPHFLLFSEARSQERASRSVSSSGSAASVRGKSNSAPDFHWRFVLESVDGSERLEAADAEPKIASQRLELLAVIRGLEALEQPSKVTLVTPSRYVVHGLRFGLTQWKENDWQWERFGELIPVKNQDLWQRLDAALRIHQVDCRSWDCNPNSDLDPEPSSPITSCAEKNALDDEVQPSLPPQVRPRNQRRKLRLDRPQPSPRSSAPAGWWGSLQNWMRRAAPTR